MGVRVVQESVASHVLGRLALSEPCEDFWSRCSVGVSGRVLVQEAGEDMACENTLKEEGTQRLLGAIGLEGDEHEGSAEPLVFTGILRL